MLLQASLHPGSPVIHQRQYVEGMAGSIFAARINIDFGEPAHYAMYLNQSGLGMSDRRYYLLADFSRERRGYQTYVLMLKLYQ